MVRSGAINPVAESWLYADLDIDAIVDFQATVMLAIRDSFSLDVATGCQEFLSCYDLTVANMAVKVGPEFALSFLATLQVDAAASFNTGGVLNAKGQFYAHTSGTSIDHVDAENFTIVKKEADDLPQSGFSVEGFSARLDVTVKVTATYGFDIRAFGAYAGMKLRVVPSFGFKWQLNYLPKAPFISPALACGLGDSCCTLCSQPTYCPNGRYCSIEGGGQICRDNPNGTAQLSDCENDPCSRAHTFGTDAYLYAKLNAGAVAYGGGDLSLFDHLFDLGDHGAEMWIKPLRIDLKAFGICSNISAAQEESSSTGISPTETTGTTTDTSPTSNDIGKFKLPNKTDTSPTSNDSSPTSTDTSPVSTDTSPTSTDIINGGHTFNTSSPLLVLFALLALIADVAAY